MNNSASLIWSFRNRIDVLLESVKTADTWCPKGVVFMLVDGASSMDSIKVLRQEVSQINREIRICESNYRTTCQEAWNIGMMLTDSRYVIFVSSDVVFKGPGWFEAIGQQFAQYAKYVYVENHAVFALDKTIIPLVGWFDEAFRHGPHVDCDYLIRLSEKGIPVTSIVNAEYYEHRDELAQRLEKDALDRLPYLTFENDGIFKDKWETAWPGWRGRPDFPHPPTSLTTDSHWHIDRRKRADVDPHPYYTGRCA